MINLYYRLQDALPRLSARDRSFAESLLEQSKQRDLSPKQLYWVEELARRAEAPEPARAAVADPQAVEGIIALINRNNKAKFPAVRFLAGDRELRLAKAGERARYPGSLNVTMHGDFEQQWYGRIHRDGRFEVARAFAAEKEMIVLALRALAVDPAKAAREYGRKTGHCCFCGMLLDDERSLLMGYGPVCARNYELPWGDRPDEEERHQ